MLTTDIKTERPQEKLLRQLCSQTEHYLDTKQIQKVIEAYELAEQAHSGQFRVSGEPYICHPLSVAIILSEMRMDAKGIMAAILHDVIEDTPVSKEDLAARFGNEVADLVDGVSKLTQLDCKSRAEAQARNVRKMVMAMVKDLRVIMVKLADRLHNMRTLEAMSPERRRRIARETLDIYAPIANRLGMNDVRLELEDLGFSAMHPFRYRILNSTVRKNRGHRKEIVATVEQTLHARLIEAGLKQALVIGREKHLYSLYQKMRSKRLPFSQVYDVYAFRIIVDSIDDCYRTLGLAHTLYKPIPGRFKDYIAVPKGNGYQSLHTVLVGPFGLPLEMQIRTRSMHQTAESGIAAHWLYKSDKEQVANSQARAHEWLRELLEIQKTAGDSLEFLDNLKVDLFQHEVYVFTPKGRVIKLPREATPVDFAYAVHTGIGNSCVSARIDRVLVPLHTTLQNGQTVEIITAPWARPNPQWLNYIVTAKARAAVRSHMRSFRQEEASQLGKRLLEQELSAHSATLEHISPKALRSTLREMNLESLEQLQEELGLGNRLPFLVAQKLLLKSESSPGSVAYTPTPLILKGTEGLLVNLAKCCRPIPGDPIIGFFNPGKGIIVHQSDCAQLSELSKKNMDPLNLEWSTEVSGDFTTIIRLELLNQLGSLAKIASAISRMSANIENISIINQDDQTSTDIITLKVKDRVHLANVMRELRQLKIVLKITRVKSETRKK